MVTAGSKDHGLLFFQAHTALSLFRDIVKEVTRFHRHRRLHSHPMAMPFSTPSIKAP